jgi:hypothetical protein
VTDEQFAVITGLLRLVVWLQVVLLGAKVVDYILQSYYYVVAMRVNRRTLFVLEMSERLQTMARDRDTHGAAILGRVEHAAHAVERAAEDVKQAVQQGPASQSGTHPPTIPPPDPESTRG